MFSDDYEILNIPKKDISSKEYNDIKEKENGFCKKFIDINIFNLINDYIKKREISKTAFFLTIYGFILNKYTTQSNIYTSVISANRNSHYTENMIGMFVSTQPILLKYDDNTTMNDTIFKNMEMLLKIYENSDISFSELVLKNINHYNNNINQIDYISEDMKEMILKSFNRDVNIIDCNKFYHIEFTNIAKKYPKKSAVIFNNIILTYKQLDEMSNSLAHYLRKQGIGRNDIVPILCERSYYYIIGILAVSKAGGSFLPIDTKFPLERVKYMLDEVNPSLVLCYHNDICNKLSSYTNYKFYEINTHNYSVNTNSIDNINKPNDTCYILFTSGTTGKPKGTLISHFNIYNYIRDFKNKENHCIYNIFVIKNNIKKLLSISNFPFDLSHIEIMFTIIHGLTVVLADELLCENPTLLSNYIIKNEADFITITPTRFKLFMENDEFRTSMKYIKVIVFIGEVLPLNICNNLRKYSKCRIYNSYGPTECSVTCTYKEVTENTKKITIGKPLCNCKIYILDKNMRPVPINVEGEIVIGGYGVGKGYLKHNKLTKEKFIPCPYENNDNNCQIMYKTGDIGKWTYNNEIECLGRTDFQVKISGQRVELGEIENTIKEINNIQNVAIIDKDKKSGEKYLICYYTSESLENKPQSKDIRNYLKNKLPRYMIPNYFKLIDKLPITRNGKLDRKLLPSPTKEDIVKEQYISPKSKMEEIICNIYSKIFNLKETEIGRKSDFLELGGDSLNAIKVSMMIEKELKIKIYIKDILSNPVVCDLSKLVEDNLIIHKDEYHSENIKINNSKEFPITSQQLGVYLDSIKNPNSVIYNLPKIFKLKKNINININIIKKGLTQIFNNHEILKSKYYSKEINGNTSIYGLIDDECKLEFETYNIENINTFVRPFNLAEAPLIRVGFINDEILLLDIHHIIADGTSISIIMNELNKYYFNNEISDTKIQFSDYAIHLNEKKSSNRYSEHYKFYRELFDCDYDIINLSNTINKFSNKEINNKESGYCTRNIDKITSNLINQYIKNNEITKTAFFLTIYGYILYKFTHQDIIYSSIISANRNSHFTENMIGMFVSTQPILLKYNNSNISFHNLIHQNMDLIFKIYNYQDISFSELSSNLKLKKVNNTFVFQPKEIIYNKFNDDKIIFSENENIYSLYDNQNNYNNSMNTKFDITFNILERNEDYSIIINYNSKLYDEKLINNIINSYIQVLSEITKFEKNINEIEYIPENEKQKILYEFNSNSYDYECDKLYHVEFSKVAKQNENKCALVCNDIHLTYKQLDEMSNSLAHYLRKQGIGRNDIIPIICERSYHFVVGVLGIMKSGAAYLPIDPEFPKDRIQ
ncbi:hypothetical protein PIROE2DRAFT_18755, partial [Piromyces sp. E2]